MEVAIKPVYTTEAAYHIALVPQDTHRSDRLVWRLITALLLMVDVHKSAYIWDLASLIAHAIVGTRQVARCAMR